MFLRLDPTDNEIAHVYYSYDTGMRATLIYSHSVRVDVIQKLFTGGDILRKWIEHEPHWWEEKPRDIGAGLTGEIRDAMPPEVEEALTW